MQLLPIVLTGPTGVGKTVAAILLAEYLHGEIINADSMQVYKGMDIGTAKPSRAEQLRVKHHLIDIVQPWETFSCGKYLDYAAPLIESLITKGIRPIIVGGSGLYIRALTEGLFKAPDADWSLRNYLMELESIAPGTLYNKLKSMDTEAASKIMENDLRRIVRALEVRLISGKNITKLQRDLTTATLPYRFIKICLTRQRDELYCMINKRVDTMISLGLVEEVRQLISQNIAATPSQAIGYKEMFSYLKGESTLDLTIDAIKQGTRRYAKRQLSWFRQEKNLQWIDISGVFNGTEIFQIIKKVVIS